jgi:hypothetical protein
MDKEPIDTLRLLLHALAGVWIVTGMAITAACSHYVSLTH